MPTETEAQANLDFKGQVIDKLGQVLSRVEEDYTRALQLEQAANTLVTDTLSAPGLSKIGDARVKLAESRQLLRDAQTLLDNAEQTRGTLASEE